MLAITPVKSYNFVSFGSYFHNVNDDDGKLKYRGDTSMSRMDLCFPDLVDFLDKKYLSAPKVNVIAHACSNGEEAYTFLSVLKARLGANSKKYTPIIAKDIEPEHLKIAEKGVYALRRFEYEMTNTYTSEKFKDYFNFVEPSDSESYKKNFIFKEKPIFVSVKKELSDNVKFRKGNILEDVKNNNLKNTVLFARNFWPYLSKQEIEELSDILAQKMDNTSTLIIGDYDKEYGIDKLLEKKGFVETPVENVYELPHKSNYTYSTSKIYDY